jgi:hypothetical protein
MRRVGRGIGEAAVLRGLVQIVHLEVAATAAHGEERPAEQGGKEQKQPSIRTARHVRDDITGVERALSCVRSQ